MSAFQPIVYVSELMRGFPAPWFVSGGWAIDLFVGDVTRKHSDIEIGIYRRDQQLLWSQLSRWSFEKVIPSDEGGKWVAWERNQDLCLPVHQIKASRSDAEPPEFEFFLNERSESHWVSRRHAGLTRPVSEVTLVSPVGIPILAPEVQLLFKAKHSRPKDHADFESVLSRLDQLQREWLATTLRTFHPEHAWIRAIEL